MCRHTRLATWRKWKPFLKRHKRRRGRGSAFWSRCFFPSTDIWTSPTMRGELPVVQEIFWHHYFLFSSNNVRHIHCFFLSVWKLFTVSSIRRWCPLMSKMISNGGRITTVLACRPTGPRLRYVMSFSMIQADKAETQGEWWVPAICQVFTRTKCCDTTNRYQYQPWGGINTPLIFLQLTFKVKHFQFSSMLKKYTS